MIGVLASGRGTNLQALLDQGLPVQAVASNVEGAPALERAAGRGIPWAAFPLAAYDSRRDRDEEMADWLGANGVELVVCAGYMHLLTEPFLDRFPCLNVHPSLLPDFPGSHAVEDALAAGAAETGVTVHFLDGGVDTGPVIAQEAAPIRPDDTPESLHARLQSIEHRLLPETVRSYLTGALRSPS